MKGLLVTLFFMASLPAMAQTYISSRDDDGGLIYDGRITFDDLNKEPSFTWLKSDEKAYVPDEHVQLFLDAYLKNYSLVIFMGTWCDDSHYLIPKLEKVMRLADYPMSSVIMYGVDRQKETKTGEQKKYNITLVPTIILYKNGTEVGRITENVNTSIEADLAAIIAKDSGKPMPH